MRRAVFLDRDGVLNRPVQRGTQFVAPQRLEQFQLYPETVEAVRIIRTDLGALAIVVTNQPDIGRGTLDPDELERMHDYLRHVVGIDDLYCCPHCDDDCACRKPKPGMLLAAAERWKIDLSLSFFIGDMGKDIQAGRKAGCQTVILRRDYNKGIVADLEAADLREAVEQIAAHWRTQHG